MTTTYHEEHLLDRAAMIAMRAMIALQPAASFGPEGRPAFDALMEKTSAPDGVTFEQSSIGGIGGWWCRPENVGAHSAVLYLHGGAYVVGSAAAYRHFVAQIAARAGTSVFIADYGLAPERPFPAAFDDAKATYRGLVAAGFTKIGLVGDSAGGGLALALLSDLINAASVEPAAVVVMSPWIDLALTGESMTSRAKADPLLSRATLQAAAQLYLAHQDPNDPRISALSAELGIFPLIQIHTGEDEVLLDDSRRYAERVKAAGGNVQLHIWQGMVHVFPANLALLRAAKEALDLLGNFLRSRLSDV
jgi:monoterpene epsilon-lactone hydrolase